MACIGYEESTAWSNATAAEKAAKVPGLEKQLNAAMKALCTFNKEVMKRDLKVYNDALEEHPDIRKLIADHVKEDKARYYKVHSVRYPTFTPDEIYKMVINGILADV